MLSDPRKALVSLVTEIGHSHAFCYKTLRVCNSSLRVPLISFWISWTVSYTVARPLQWNYAGALSLRSDASTANPEATDSGGSLSWLLDDQ